MELFAADGHDAGGCERVTGKSGMRPPPRVWRRRSHGPRDRRRGDGVPSTASPRLRVSTWHLGRRRHRRRRLRLEPCQPSRRARHAAIRSGREGRPARHCIAVKSPPTRGDRSTVRNQRRYEYELLCRLREVLPAGVKVTVVADRGFADCKLFYALTTELAFEYVIRLRGDIYVTNARGERRAAAAWVGAGGRARRLVGARVTDAYELPVGVVVCVHDPKMDEPWCLVASEATIPTRVLIRYYGKRWGIEAGFRDIKDMRFGMGLSSIHVSRPDRRDRLLLISALAIAVLSLLGAAGERIGYDRWLKANTVKRRTHSLFRQGLMLYHHLPNWPEDRVRPLMATFGSMLMEQRVYREVFGVI